MKQPNRAPFALPLIALLLCAFSPRLGHAACSLKNALVAQEPVTRALLRAALVGNDEVDPEFYFSVRKRAFFLTGDSAEIEAQNEEIRKVLVDFEESDHLCPAEPSGKRRWLSRDQ